MAQVLNGSFNTTAYSGRYLTLSWSATQSTANNTSTISWSLKGAGGSTTNYYKAGNFKVIIAGETVYNSTARISLYNGTTVASGTKVIYHNAGGDKSFAASAEAGIYTYDVNCKGSGSWELKSIARAATITSAPNFTDEDSPTIKYSNVAGNATTKLEACIKQGENIIVPYRTITKTATEYKFNFTDTERKNLRQAVKSGSSIKVNYFIRTTIGTTVLTTKTADKTFSLINHLPILNPTVEDTNSRAQALIGYNPNEFIKGYNTISYTIGATAQKEATITSTKITCLNKSNTAATGTLTNVEGNTFTISATDSRGNTTTDTITLSMVDYIKLTISQKMQAEVVEDNIGKVNISLEGNYFSGTFGAANNTLSFSYRIKEQGGSYGNWISVAASPSIYNNTYNVEFEVNNLNYNNSYVIQCQSADLITTISADEYPINFIPVFDWSNEDFNFNVPISIEGKPLNDFVIDEGNSGIWHYRIWNSGRAECWGRNTKSITLSKAWGTMFIGTTYFDRVSYPFAFAATPTEIATLNTAGGSGWLFPESAGNGINGTHQTAVYNVCRPTSVASGVNFTLNYYVSGYLA